MVSAGNHRWSGSGGGCDDHRCVFDLLLHCVAEYLLHQALAEWLSGLRHSSQIGALREIGGLGRILCSSNQSVLLPEYEI